MLRVKLCILIFTFFYICRNEHRSNEILETKSTVPVTVRTWLEKKYSVNMHYLALPFILVMSFPGSQRSEIIQIQYIFKVSFKLHSSLGHLSLFHAHTKALWLIYIISNIHSFDCGSR